MQTCLRRTNWTWLLVWKKKKALICSNPSHFSPLPTQRWNTSVGAPIVECFKWNCAPSYKTVTSTEVIWWFYDQVFYKRHAKIYLNMKATAHLITLVLQTRAQPSRLDSLLQLFAFEDDLSWIEWISFHQPVWNIQTQSTEKY